MNGEQLREEIFKEFKKIFEEGTVFTKRRTATNSGDDFNTSIMYNPELDIWVGPVNINKNITDNNFQINKSLDIYQDILNEMNNVADKKYNPSSLNENPRFFLAIEVAGTGSSKHLLGEMFNSSILGKIGIVIAANQTILDTYLRHVEYINFAHDVKKTRVHFNNLMIIDGQKLLGLFKN